MPFEDLSDAVLRPAVAADAPAVTRLTHAVYARYVPLMGREPVTMKADQAANIRDHQVFILEIGGEMVASLELIAEEDCLVVENIAVAEERQGQGLGKRLMAFAEAEARRQGHARLRLYTNETMVENLALYRRLGYVETERIPVEGTDVVHMRKRLDPCRAES